MNFPVSLPLGELATLWTSKIPGSCEPGQSDQRSLLTPALFYMIYSGHYENDFQYHNRGIRGLFPTIASRINRGPCSIYDGPDWRNALPGASPDRTIVDPRTHSGRKPRRRLGRPNQCARIAWHFLSHH